MGTATEDRRETLAEHREALEAARAAIFDTPTVEDEFGEVQWTYAGLKALAEVSTQLWQLAAYPNRSEVGDDELSWEKVRQIAPMKDDVANALFQHGRRLKRIESAMMETVCELEQAVQALAAGLGDYGDDVQFPVLEALKELELNTDTEVAS